MNRRKILSKNIVSALEHSHHQTEHKLTEFHTALQNLRCEGKLAYGKNLKEIKSIVEFLKIKLLRHMQCEEKCLFPFLRRSVPKLEVIIGLMIAEHDEFRKSLSDMSAMCSKIGRSETALHNNKYIQQLYELGQSIIFLLRHHLYFEQTRIYEAIRQDLKPEEKKDLRFQLSKLSAVA